LSAREKSVVFLGGGGISAKLVDSSSR